MIGPIIRISELSDGTAGYNQQDEFGHEHCRDRQQHQPDRAVLFFAFYFAGGFLLLPKFGTQTEKDSPGAAQYPAPVNSPLAL